MFVSSTNAFAMQKGGRNAASAPAYGRFLQADPIGYEDNANLYAYVHNDPVNLIDPLGLTPCTSETTVCGHCNAGTVAVSANTSSGIMCVPDSEVGKQRNQVGPGGGGVGGGGAIVVTAPRIPIVVKPPQKQTPPCGGIDPSKTGQVTFVATTIGGAFGLGASITHGTFRTESGVAGTFTAIEFLVGLRGEVGVVTGFSRNLATFMGGNDTISESLGLDDISANRDLDGNTVGASTTVAGKGINVGLTGGFSNTDITITQCH